MTETVYVTRLQSRGQLPYSWHSKLDCSHGPANPIEVELSKVRDSDRFNKCRYCAGEVSGPTNQNTSYLEAAKNADPEEVFAND